MPDLRTALATHRRAVQAFLTSAHAVPPGQWNRPRAPGKWSPGQIAEHLALSYEAGRDVLLGRAPGPGAPRLLRPLLRAFLLRPVLRRRRFPAASKSPAMLWPEASPAGASELLDRLHAAATAFEHDAAAARDATIDHPAFGRVPLTDFVLLQEIHTQHHHGQMPWDAR